MSEIVIYGPAVSSYVLTARWALAEKGIAHQLKPIEFGSEAHAELHPFRKVPVMTDGDFVLPESLAIVQYADGSGDGPPLIPTELRLRAEAYKWVSIINSYLYRRLIPDYVLKYVLPSLRGEEPSRSEIEAGVPEMKRSLELLETGLGDSAWFAGDTFSLADLFVAPIVGGVARFPEGGAELEGKPNLRRFMAAVQKRDAWKAVQAG